MVMVVDIKCLDLGRIKSICKQPASCTSASSPSAWRWSLDMKETISNQGMRQTQHTPPELQILGHASERPAEQMTAVSLHEPACAITDAQRGCPHFISCRWGVSLLYHARQEMTCSDGESMVWLLCLEPRWCLLVNNGGSINEMATVEGNCEIVRLFAKGGWATCG